MLTNERVALIVGAGNEIGQAVAQDLAKSGLRVALNDLLPTRIENLAADIKSKGGQAAVYAADLTRKLALQTSLQSILEAWGRIDVLVFVATVQPGANLLDMDEWDWHRTIDSNLTAAFLCMQSVGRVMREIGGGVIINVLAGTMEASAGYAASSSGLEALSVASAQELSAHNIQVHALRAGSTTSVDILRLVRISLPA